MKKAIPFALPDLGEEEIDAVVETLRSGWLTSGRKTQQFEQSFQEFMGEGIEAIAVNSATSGLHLALEAVGIQAGDEVITTPYTFTATAEVIRYLDAHPVFVDIDPQTFNIDPQKIKAAITPRTKAIIPVHIGGLACDMTAILELAHYYNLKVIEDAAHAIPSTHQGKLIGSLESEATVFSFYATKPIATGEGGMVVTHNPAIAQRCRTMRLHGINRDPYRRQSSEEPSWYYEVIAPGFRYNMTDITASLGIEQLKKAWEHQKQRSHIAQTYFQELGHLPLILPPQPVKNDIHAWHLYIIQLQSRFSLSRNQLIEELGDRGIECSVHYIPLHLHPYWQKTYHLSPQDFPHALEVYQNALSIPIYSKLSEGDHSYIIDSIKQVIHAHS